MNSSELGRLSKHHFCCGVTLADELPSTFAENALNTKGIVILTPGGYEYVNRNTVEIVCWTYDGEPLRVGSPN